MILGLENWIFYTGLGLILFIIGLFIEPVRDLYIEVWDFIVSIFDDFLGDLADGIIYIITFQWVADIPDFFGTMFDDITEFSLYGIAFGLMALILIYYIRSYMIEPFVQYYSPTGRAFWTIATYVTVFIGGYFMGKFFENS